MAKLTTTTFLFAHGAGADMDSEWILSVSHRLESAGLDVVRFNFPYMDKRREDGKRRPPDRQPKLLEAFKAQLDLLIKPNQRLIIGGKSMGGRMASLLASESPQGIDGVVCMGFPFHPPGKPEKYRGEHLKAISTPTLILQGERDTFGTREEIANWQFAENVRIDFLPDGDHGFKPRKKSGGSLEENLELAVKSILKFVEQI